MIQLKVVILCGGMGTRLREETESKPKPLVFIGGKPVLVHIMEGYMLQGYNEFILCLGYKGEMIKEYFLNYHWMVNDFTLHLNSTEDKIIKHTERNKKFNITFVDTGAETLTGGRVKAIEEYIKEDTFFLTYGDGVSDVDINKTLEFHRDHGKICTVTGIRPILKYGVIKISSNNLITAFSEKPLLEEWINGGFFVCNKRIFKYIDKDCSLEKEPFEKLVKDKQMMMYKHEGFWHCMDTFKDVEDLNKLYIDKNAPWVIKKSRM